MRHRYVSLLILLAGASFARAADTLPSMDDLQKQLDAKDYPSVLAGTNRILQLRGPATASYHRTAVWMMKAEALLHSSQFGAAGQAYTSGAEEKDATDDERDLCLATATLLKHSDRKGYTPKATRDQPAPQTYDILDPQKRKDAIAALFNAELSDATPKIDKLKDTTVPNPLVSAAKALAELRPMERVVDKNADKVDALEKSLGDNFTKKMADWQSTNSKRLDELATLAQQTTISHYTDNKGIVHSSTTYRGLMAQEQTEIRDMEKQAQAYAQTEQQVAASLGEIGKAAIEPSQKTIQSLYDQAQSTRRNAMVQR